MVFAVISAEVVAVEIWTISRIYFQFICENVPLWVRRGVGHKIQIPLTPVNCDRPYQLEEKTEFMKFKRLIIWELIQRYYDQQIINFWKWRSQQDCDMGTLKRVIFCWSCRSWFWMNLLDLFDPASCHVELVQRADFEQKLDKILAYGAQEGHI